MKRVSSFKQWLYFTESVEENFDEWLESIKSYAKPNEAALRTIQIGPNQKKLIIDVLKEKRKENQDFMKLLLGVFHANPESMKEDLEAAVDIINKLLMEKDKDNNPIHTKKEIAADGWFNTGTKVLTQLNDKLNQHLQSKVGKRQELLAKKKGLSQDLEPIYNENGIKIYHFPPLTDKDPTAMANRHKQYCRYGKETRWCTAQPSWEAYKDYLDNDIYVLHDHDVPMYQWVKARQKNAQFMDIKNQRPVFIIDKYKKAIEKAGLLDTMAPYDIKTIMSKEDFEKLSDDDKIKAINDMAHRKEFAFQLSDQKVFDPQLFKLAYDAWFDPNNDETIQAFLDSRRHFESSWSDLLVLALSIGSNDVALLEKLKKKEGYTPFTIFQALQGLDFLKGLSGYDQNRDFAKMTKETYEWLWDQYDEGMKSGDNKKFAKSEAVRKFTHERPELIAHFGEEDLFDTFLSRKANNIPLPPNIMNLFYASFIKAKKDPKIFMKLYNMFEKNNLLNLPMIVREGPDKEEGPISYLFQDMAFTHGCEECLEFLWQKDPSPKNWMKAIFHVINVALYRHVADNPKIEQFAAKILEKATPEDLAEMAKAMEEKYAELDEVPPYLNSGPVKMQAALYHFYSKLHQPDRLHKAMKKLASTNPKVASHSEIEYIGSLLSSSAPLAKYRSTIKNASKEEVENILAEAISRNIDTFMTELKRWMQENKDASGPKLRRSIHDLMDKVKSVHRGLRIDYMDQASEFRQTLYAIEERLLGDTDSLHHLEYNDKKKIYELVREKYEQLYNFVKEAEVELTRLYEDTFYDNKNWRDSGYRI